MEADIKPQVLRTARVESLISAVQIGEGISLFPESNFRLFRHDGLVAIPLSDAPALQVGIAYKKDRKLFPILREFQNFLFLNNIFCKLIIPTTAAMISVIGNVHHTAFNPIKCKITC